jgi:hypothetical protein
MENGRSVSQSPDNPSNPKPNRWQFSISGMLVFTLSVAIGAAVVRCNAHSWLGISPPENVIIKVGYSGGLIAILVFWMFLGILYQVRDLRTALASHDNLTSEQSWGLRFEIFWRLTIAALLAMYCLLAFLIDRCTLTLSDWENGSSIPTSTIREAVAIMILLVIVGSVPCCRYEQRNTLLRRGLHLIVFLLAVAFCVVRGLDYTIVSYLVHIATVCIDSAQAIKFSKINPFTYNFNTALFFWWSLFSVLIIFANWAILLHFARQWSEGCRRRLIWGSLLIAGVVAASAFVIWIMAYGLHGFSPYFASVENKVPSHCWFAVGLLIVILTTLMTYRMAVNRNPLAQAPQTTWQQNPNKYYHEQRWILLLLVVAIVWLHYDIYFSLRKASEPIFKALGMSSLNAVTWQGLCESWFSLPTDYLWLSLILLSLHRAFTRRNEPRQPQAALPQINPAKFVTVWFGALAVIISGIPTLAWMSFALWFNPWFRGRWP